MFKSRVLHELGLSCLLGTHLWVYLRGQVVSLSSLLENSQTVFQSPSNMVHPHQHLLLSVFSILAILVPLPGFDSRFLNG